MSSIPGFVDFAIAIGNIRHSKGLKEKEIKGGVYD